MKTKNIFLGIIFLFSGLIFTINGQIHNTFMGTGAGLNNTANGNSGFGYQTLSNNTTYGNSAFGYQSLQNNSGSSNIAIGYRALRTGNQGNYNIAFGHRVMASNTTGNNNIIMGLRAFETNTTGGSNIAIGPASLFNNTKGNHNIAMGYNSGFNLTTGNNNVLIGYHTAIGLTEGDNNVILGTSLTVKPDIVKTVIMGAANDQYIYIDNTGYTGIGLGNNVIPLNRLELGKGIAGTSGLRFRNYTNVSPANEPSTGKVLTVNVDGDVVLTTDNSIYQNDGIINQTTTTGINREVDLNNRNIWFNTSTSTANGRVYIGAIPNYPTSTGDYRLYVEGGILTEKVKVALRSTANWADYVFETDFELMSLEAVEAYIKANKHLPGIESAEELVNNGLDLGDMQAKQMAKIEELTLHLIDQNKTLKKQSEEIETLKKLVQSLLDQK